MGKVVRIKLILPKWKNLWFRNRLSLGIKSRWWGIKRFGKCMRSTVNGTKRTTVSNSKTKNPSPKPRTRKTQSPRNSQNPNPQDRPHRPQPHPQPTKVTPRTTPHRPLPFPLPPALHPMPPTIILWFWRRIKELRRKLNVNLLCILIKVILRKMEI